MLGEADRGRIEDAIRAAERGTAGEIVLVVTPQASRYRTLPFALALTAALLVPWPLIALTEFGPVRIAICQLAAALVAGLAAAHPRVRLSLAPALVRRSRAREAAEREFRSRGMAQTRGRTGVLLFVALAEHHAEVIGDVAIAGSVPDEAWRRVIEALTDAFGRGAHADGLVAAIGAIGVILAEHAPGRPDDVDELPNRVVLL